MEPRVRESLSKLEMVKHQGEFKITHRGKLLLVTPDWQKAHEFFGDKLKEIKREAVRT